MKNLEIITAAVSHIIKAAIPAARWFGKASRRSLEKLVSMDADAKDKELLCLRDNQKRGDHLAMISSSVCVFRAMPITDSGRSRSLIPIQADHRFRSKPITWPELIDLSRAK